MEREESKMKELKTQSKKMKDSYKKTESRNWLGSKLRPLEIRLWIIYSLINIDLCFDRVYHDWKYRKLPLLCVKYRKREKKLD